MKNPTLVILLALAPLSWGAVISYDQFYETLGNPDYAPGPY